MSTHVFTTYAGIQFDLLNPKPEDIHIADIAHALSQQCRYNGHCDSFYSVAQHSVLVSQVVPPGLAVRALLHDAAEAYVGDIVRAVKRLPWLRASWEAFESTIQDVICESFGIEAEMAPEIKEADDRMALTEMRDLFRHEFPPSLVRDGLLPYAFRISPMSNRIAESTFLNHLREAL